jgi:hypothetical protein
MKNLFFLFILLTIMVFSCKKEHDGPSRPTQHQIKDTILIGCDSFYLGDVIKIMGQNITITPDMRGKSVVYDTILVEFDFDLEYRLHPDSTQFLFELICDVPKTGNLNNYDTIINKVYPRITVPLDSAYVTEDRHYHQPPYPFVHRGHVKRVLFSLPEYDIVISVGFYIPTMKAYNGYYPGGYDFDQSYILSQKRYVSRRMSQLLDVMENSK